MPRSPVNDTTRRFSDRVANYVRYRPSYPSDLVNALIKDSGIGPGQLVADIGAGTGIFSGLLLEQGLQVVAVEPNDAMRAAADELLGSFKTYVSAKGQSENTGLADASVDLVTAAQAFHWFEQGPARKEFQRILKPGGRVALVWNERTLGTPFQDDYERVLTDFTEDYATINHTNITSQEITEFFFPGKVAEKQFENFQAVDREGLLGRVESASYCPRPGTPGYPIIVAALNQLFDRHQQGGAVTLSYVTRLYLGSLEPDRTA